MEWRPTGFLRVYRILEEVHAGREMNERLWQRAVAGRRGTRKWNLTRRRLAEAVGQGTFVLLGIVEVALEGS